METKTRYGLKHIKENRLLGVTRRHTDADCSVDEIHELSLFSDETWLVEEKLTASYVRKFSTEWYNADYETPTNNFNPNDLVVVKVVTTQSVEDAKPDYVPTFEEYMNLKYNTPNTRYYDPGHYKVVLDECKRRGKPGTYSIYDLKLLGEI